MIYCCLKFTTSRDEVIEFKVLELSALVPSCSVPIWPVFGDLELLFVGENVLVMSSLPLTPTLMSFI